LELPTSNQANLMRAIKKELAAPVGHNRAHLLERERKQRQRCAQRDEFRAHERGRLAEHVQIYDQLRRVHRHIHDFQPAHPRRAIAPVARMPAEGLRDAHDHVTWVGEGRIRREIAEHTRDQTVVGIAGAKHAFE